MSQRVLVLGAKGLLGRSLLRHVSSASASPGPQPVPIQVYATDQDDLPLEDPDGIERFLREKEIDRVLLLAAWTAVDDCEADPERAFRVNGILAGRAAAVTAKLGLPILFMSTDYVFDGNSPHPYREYDPARPMSVYARSKWYGECAVRSASPLARIVRTSGLYGPGGPDFVRAILDRLRQGPVQVVTDEVNAPTLVDDLAPAVWRVALGDQAGTYHLAGAGEVSRFEMARRIATLSGYDPEQVRPTTHAILRRSAPRPKHSTLDCQAARETFGIRLPAWEDALARYLADIARPESA